VSPLELFTAFCVNILATPPSLVTERIFDLLRHVNVSEDVDEHNLKDIKTDPVRSKENITMSQTDIVVHFPSDLIES